MPSYKAYKEDEVIQYQYYCPELVLSMYMFHLRKKGVQFHTLREGTYRIPLESWEGTVKTESCLFPYITPDGAPLMGDSTVEWTLNIKVMAGALLGIFTETDKRRKLVEKPMQILQTFNGETAEVHAIIGERKTQFA